MFLPKCLLTVGSTTDFPPFLESYTYLLTPVRSITRVVYISILPYFPIYHRTPGLHFVILFLNLVQNP